MISKDIFSEIESEVQSYARAFPCVFDKALGTEIWDVEGERYLDFLAGAGTLSYGHNNPIFKTALINYIARDAITHSLDLHTLAKKEFLEAMRDIIFKPRNLDYVIQFTGPTGANAVEAALKLARKVTGRTNVICFTNGFHGVSTGALAATGNKYHREAAGVPLYGTSVMPYDNYLGKEFSSTEYIEKLLSDPSSGIDLPAAIILETVQGEGGLNAASNIWLQQLQRLCKQKNILLIVDDIQAGCGRTGTFFSFEPSGIQPDIVTLSKSLSGYGLPFSLVLIKREYDQWAPGEHNGTFRGNNLAFVTATAMLQNYWCDNRFAQDIKDKSKYLHQRLTELVRQHSPHLVEVRGRGMMQGILCLDPNRAAAITSNAYQQGLIIERSGPNDEVIKCLMPLTTSKAELKEGLDILQACCATEFAEKRDNQIPREFIVDTNNLLIKRQLARRLMESRLISKR